uniref:Uncharacterized protein n=1 Tax=Romanomermis culicivorax TaxID=13658 RepID=A0A915KML8_ROMCU
MLCHMVRVFCSTIAMRPCRLIVFSLFILLTSLEDTSNGDEQEASHDNDDTSMLMAEAPPFLFSGKKRLGFPGHLWNEPSGLINEGRATPPRLKLPIGGQPSKRRGFFGRRVKTTPDMRTTTCPGCQRSRALEKGVKFFKDLWAGTKRIGSSQELNLRYQHSGLMSSPLDHDTKRDKPQSDHEIYSNRMSNTQPAAVSVVNIFKREKLPHFGGRGARDPRYRKTTKVRYDWDFEKRTAVPIVYVSKPTNVPGVSWEWWYINEAFGFGFGGLAQNFRPNPNLLQNVKCMRNMSERDIFADAQ